MTSLQKVIKYCAGAFAVLLSVSIIGGICSALGMMSVFFDGDEEIAGEMMTYEVSNEVEKLDVDISAASFRIVNGDSFSVESNHKHLNVKEKNGTLRIFEDKVRFGVSSEGISVVLTVPDNYSFENAVISAGAGKVDIDVLSANTLDLDLGAGETKINRLDVYGGAEVDSGTGKLTIMDGEMNDVSMDIGVGALDFTGKLTGNCEVDYGIGNAELTLLGNSEDYRIELDKGVGGATLDGQAMSDGSVYGNGQNRIDIDGGVGNIRIQFE